MIIIIVINSYFYYFFLVLIFDNKTITVWLLSNSKKKLVNNYFPSIFYYLKFNKNYLTTKTQKIYHVFILLCIHFIIKFQKLSNIIQPLDRDSKCMPLRETNWSFSSKESLRLVGRWDGPASSFRLLRGNGNKG